MFETIIVNPIFNVLLVIYGLLGQNLGVAIIVFTVLVRLLMWPLLKKQLHQTRIMRQLQPRLKEIRKQADGNKTLESQMVMELYKEHGINPIAPFILLLIQVPVFFGLYAALINIIDNPPSIVDRTFEVTTLLPAVRNLVTDVSTLNTDFFGLFDVTDHAIGRGPIVLPALAVALLAGLFQFLQLRQTTSRQKDRKTLRQLLKESSETGQQPDQAEVMAATTQKMGFILAPLIVYIAAIAPAGVALYFAVGGMMGYFQQRRVLNEDEVELEAVASEPDVKRTKSGTTVRRIKAGESKPAASAGRKKKRAKKAGGRKSKGGAK